MLKSCLKCTDCISNFLLNLSIYCIAAPGQLDAKSLNILKKVLLPIKALVDVSVAWDASKNCAHFT